MLHIISLHVASRPVTFMPTFAKEQALACCRGEGPQLDDPAAFGSSESVERGSGCWAGPLRSHKGHEVHCF